MQATGTFAAAALAFLVSAVCNIAANAETLNLNADWRFSWAKESIPLKQALASMEKCGAAVSDPAYDDSGWERVSLPHPVNAHDSFDGHSVDAGEAEFRRGVMFYRKRFVMPEGTGIHLRQGYGGQDG